MAGRSFVVMTRILAKRIADRVNRDWGEVVCSPDDVLAVVNHHESLGSGREAVESRILQECDETLGG